MKAVIEMAKKCGIPEFENNESQAENIMRFADLIRADERDRIKAANAPEIEKINAHIKALEDAVVSEREACAKVCEEMRVYVGRDNAMIQSSAKDCAAAIRARGQV